MNRNAKTLFRADSESGIVLMVFAMILVVGMTILAMVVDHSKQALALTTLQRAADAAALSGAKRFNGTKTGWQDAKLAAVAALKQNPIHGIDTSQLAELRLDEGPSAYDGSLSFHKGSIGTTSGLHVQVERGVLWFDHRLDSPSTRSEDGEKNGGYRFVSLETPIDDTNLNFPQGLKGFSISNAVRVKINLESLPTTFGRLLGIDAFNDLERSAIAVTHEELQLPVAPIAIPLCALQLNTDPYAGEGEHTTESIDLAMQCTRQGVATEADPLRELPEVFGAVDKLRAENEILRRREGFTRFQTFPRPSYVDYSSAKGPNKCVSSTYNGRAHNCKNILLSAVMGVPSFAAGNEADAKQVANAFRQGSEARLGMYFAPLTNVRDFSDNPAYRGAIADAINSPETRNQHNASVTFKDAFTTSADGNIAARTNFPAIRTFHPAPPAYDPEQRGWNPSFTQTYDLKLYWPTLYEGANGGPAIETLLMDLEGNSYTRAPLDYTNPMCHDPAIPINSLNSTKPDRHRVRRMLAPVIAPGTPKRPDGKPAMYCNYDEVFENYQANGESSAVAPVPKSLPVIVGFVPINLYDFNLQDLDRVSAFAPASDNTKLFNRTDVLGSGATLPPNEWASTATPVYQDPETGETAADRHPGELDVLNSFITKQTVPAIAQFEEDQGEWEECVNEKANKCESSKPKPTGGKFLGIPYEFLACFDFRQVFASPALHGLNVVEGVEQIEPDTCQKTVLDALGNSTTVSYDCIQKGGKAQQLSEQYFGIMKDFFGKNIKAAPNKHCLPRKDIQDANKTNDKSNPNYYVQPMDSTRAGYGCGGILFKTDCGEPSVDRSRPNPNPFFLAGGVNWDETSPALVKEDVNE